VKKNYTDKVKDYFDFNKTEQRGIVTLFLLILLVIAINLLLPCFVKKSSFDQLSYIHDIAKFKQSLTADVDSLNFKHRSPTEYNDVDRSIAEKSLHPFPFNPNGLSEEKWKQMGLDTKQIKIIKNFEARGGKFYKKEDLQKIYGISESDYRALEPFIDIPVQQYDKKKTELTEYKSVQKIVEINSADSVQLTGVRGIGPFYARRIIKYRDRLGGFTCREQLMEVYGMDSVHYSTIAPYITVDPSLIRKININTATFKDLMKNPYIDYYMASAIMKYRGKKGKFSSLDELMNINLIYDEVYRKISPYLTVN